MKQPRRVWLLVLLAGGSVLAPPSCGCNESVVPGGPPCPPAHPWFVESHTVWGPSGGAIRLDRDVFVTADGVLEILPGAVIRFVDRTVCVDDPSGRIWREPVIHVEGQLLCEGKPDSLIVMTTTGDHFADRRIEIRASEARAGDSIIAWADVGFVQWADGNPTLAHSKVAGLLLSDCGEILIEDCSLGLTLVLGGGRGTVRGSAFSEGLSVYDDSLLITGNVFRDVPSEYWGAIRSNTTSRSLITRNLFEDCEIGVGIYSGTPRLHYNNFVGNRYNLSVIAEPEPPESDTIDARDNWWGTTDGSEILERIHYEKRDGRFSGKTVLSSPYALEPFDLSATGGASARRSAPERPGSGSPQETAPGSAHHGVR